MGLIEEHLKLSERIVSGKMTRADVERELCRIELEYGSNAFNYYTVKKKQAPWTQKDLDELEIKSASGAGSKEFYLYMAEVSEYVYKAKKKHGLLGLFERIIKFVAKNWILVVGIILFVVLIYVGIAKFIGRG